MTEYEQFNIDINSYSPEVHPNCTCMIVNGIWQLGESMSGPCPICIEMQKEWNG